MNELAYARLLWQIPVLVLLAAGFLPEISWYSSMFGAWPIWLCSFPAGYVIQQWLGHRNMAIPKRTIESPQVLVFYSKRVASRATKHSIRQAA